MEENESGRKRKIVFAVNGLTKSGQMLFITIPAKIRPCLDKDASYKVVLEVISDAS